MRLLAGLTVIMLGLTGSTLATAQSISIANLTQAEGNSGTTSFDFTISLSASSGSTVTVDWTTANGTAIAPGDYIAASGTATFLPGSTSEIVTVQVVGETLWENTEAFSIQLSNPVNATISDGSALGRIDNDDVRVSIAYRTADEGNSGTTDFDLTLTLSGTYPLEFRVDWATQDGAAIAPGDYIAASGTAIFPPGSTTQIVTVSVVGDTVYEPQEHFYVNLSNPVNGGINDGLAVARIDNDDVRVSIANLTQDEGNSGTTDFNFTLTLSATYPLEFRVDWATTNGTAIAPGDYIAASGTAVFPPGSTMQIVTVSVVGDTDYEGNDYFYVNLSNPVNGSIYDGSASCWISNDDVRVSIANLTQDEGNTGTTDFNFTLTLSDTYPLEFRVDWATTNGTAIAPGDYIAASGTAVFPPGSTSQIVTVQVVGDTNYEVQEYFYVNLSNPVNGSIYDGSASCWISNDDVRVSIGDVNLAEGNTGTTDFNFTLTLSGIYPLEFRVDWATSNGTAIAPGDYIAASGTAVFPPGSTSQIVTVQVVGETAYEQTEYFYVTLSNPVNGSINDGSAAAWINNDDVRVSIASLTQDEGNSGTTDFVFNVTLSAAYDLPTSVDWATADSSAVAPDDYLTASGTADFPAGETLRTVTVQVVGDLVKEVNEQFLVSLSNPVNMGINTGTAAGGITNDDSYPEITIHDAVHFEGNSGNADFDLPITLSGPYGEEVSVHFTTSDGTAVATDDYISTISSVVFPPGVTAGVATVPVVGDHEVEPDETFEVTLYSPTNVTIIDGTAVATILNDDLAGDLFIDDVSLSEGDTGTTDFIFTVSLAESNLATIQVDYATADGAARGGVDYVPASGTVIFDPGEIDKPVTVQVIGDTMDECFEDFSVLLSNPVNGTIGDGEGTGTILSDDVLACDDSDGDCFHDVDCGGRDCDDTVAATYPEAVEVNDALDNQCPAEHGYGVVDEISGVCGFLNPADATEFSWPAQASATSYDVARSTVPDFSSDCTLLPVTPDPYILDPTTPVAGQVFFYLVRPLAAYQGSWGQDWLGAERLFTCP